MKAEELRRSVLQLAVEGKLVEQRPEEGTAKELLAEIAAERERLVREGKMKRSKPLAPVSPDEVPFEIPESWDWCWFTDVTRTVGGNNKILASEVQETGLYPAISQGKDYIDGYCDFSEKLVSDIPLVLFGDHTRNIKYIDFKFVISGDGVKLVKPLSFDEKYLYYWMVLTTKQLRDRGYARHFSLLKNQLFPLPPLAEQRRIVARLEELMPLIDAYDAEERRLSALETEFPEQLRRSLLQYAVEGKLVEQRPDGEGTAFGDCCGTGAADS